jgi:hypothetical protein
VKLSERLEALLALSESTDDAERDINAPDAECVFVDMRPAEFQALVESAADLARRFEDAQIREVEEEMHGLVILAHPLQKGQRVRLVPEDGQEAGDGADT